MLYVRPLCMCMCMLYVYVYVYAVCASSAYVSSYMGETRRTGSVRVATAATELQQSCNRAATDWPRACLIRLDEVFTTAVCATFFSYYLPSCIAAVACENAQNTSTDFDYVLLFATSL